MVLLTLSSRLSRYSWEDRREVEAEAAAVEAVVAEVPILPRLRAVGMGTSDRKLVIGCVVDDDDDDDAEEGSLDPSVESREGVV